MIAKSFLFTDSKQFKGSNLQDSVKNLTKDRFNHLPQQFRGTGEKSNLSIWTVQKILIKKNYARSQFTFYRSFEDEHKLDEDYESINKTWDEFEKEAVRQYHDLNKNRCFAIDR